MAYEKLRLSIPDLLSLLLILIFFIGIFGSFFKGKDSVPPAFG
jgi:hypothetical protein